MKKLITLTVLTLLLAMSLTKVADACSLLCGPAVSFPLQEQNVPINTDIHLGFYCSTYSDYTVSLVDSKTGTSVMLSEVEVSDKQVVLRPSQLLTPFSNYELRVEHIDQENYWAQYDVIQEFTTGDTEDNEAPTIEDAEYEITIDYAEKDEEVSVNGGASCGGSFEVNVEDINDEQLLEYATYLPEHYSITIRIDNVVDESGLYFLLTEIDEDGSEVDHGQQTSYIKLHQGETSEAEFQKTYRLWAVDGIGNVQEDAIDIVITYNKKDSSYEVFINEDVVGGGGGGGGGGGSEASKAGCNLSRGAANNANISFLIFLILPFLAVVRRKVRQR